MKSLLELRPAVFAVAFAVAGAGCDEEPEPRTTRNVCVKTLTGDVEVPTETAADILIVVDNSGSMQEEQDNLAANFLNLTVDANGVPECPLQDLRNIPLDFKNPRPELFAPGGALEKCGFIQLVAAFENDFRIGVITTDVGICDNRLAPAGDPRGFHPQRGCLQPDAAGRKVIARADLDDADADNDLLATRFEQTLAGISTFGSPFERGLDAMNTFLDPATPNRHPDCVGDLDLFRRAEANLVVIFLTDEEDCSHGLAGALEVFGDELAPDPLVDEEEPCGPFPAHFLGVTAADCYAKLDDLSPIDAYDDVLLAHDPRAKVAVIAGGILDGNGSVVPAGCIVGAEGAPEGGSEVCFSSGGQSNFTGANEICGPDRADERGGLPCCLADSGSRYFQFADLVGNQATDSICNESFRGTMLDIAAFIAAVDSVKMAQPPDQGGVLVEVTRLDAEGQPETLILEELPAGADCAIETGFQLDGDRVVLCGEGRAGPGDGLVIRARGEEEPECGQPLLEVSGGGVNCAHAGALPAIAVLGLLLRRRRAR